MSTENQINANRLNAQKSTGPKTPDGKAKISQNAVTHGLCSTRPILSTEDPEKYDQLRDDFFRRHAPEGVLGNALAERAVNTYWRLLRVQNFETLVFNNLLNVARSEGDKLGGLPDGTLIAAVLEQDFAKEHIFEKLQRYELRIDRSHRVILKELRTLQAQRLQQAESNSSFLDSGLSSLDSNTQNKPNPVQSKPETLNNKPKSKVSNRPLSDIELFQMIEKAKATPIAPDVMKMITKHNPGRHKIPA
jgi:hypothetical protein